MRTRDIRCISAFTTLLLLLLSATASAQGHILIFTSDGATEGFNDPTPAVPAGGNPGVTRGQQRVFVFLTAAAMWEQTVKPKNDIFVIAAFDPLGPTVLGSAGTQFIHANFPGAELPGTWYPDALADQLAGTDLNPCCFDIGARFNSGFPFYLGTDNNHGLLNDLLTVVLHELAHGLGFANFVNENTGARPSNLPDVYSQYTLDTTTGLNWNSMTDAQRATSAKNVRKVVWDGINVNNAVPGVLSPGEPTLEVLSPASIGPFFPIGPAAFGPPITAAGIAGEVVLADDGAAPVSDGCTPLVNGAAISGKIALIDRGVCTFTVKVKNAQDAGAIAVLIADTAQDSPPPGLGGVDPTITIPSARISLTDANAIKTSLPAVQVNLTLDLSVIAGTDHDRGLMMVAALDPVQIGSSISHFEAVAQRNQLMEPAINDDLTHSVEPPEDLTLPLMTDIGWFSDGDGVPDGVDSCLGSDTRGTVVFGTCETTAPNVVFLDGCSIADRIAACAASAPNHGQLVSCAVDLLKGLEDAGWLTKGQAREIKSCVAH